MAFDRQGDCLAGFAPTLWRHRFAALPAGLEGGFEGRFDRPDRHVVKVEAVALAGLQRLQVEVLGGDLGEGLVALGHESAPVFG